jgi:RND superfamily putative drug exporter
MDLNLGSSSVNTLPTGYESRDGMDVLTDEFSPGMLAPVRIVIDGYDSLAVREATGTLIANLESDATFGASQLQLNEVETEDQPLTADLALLNVFMAVDPYSPAASSAISYLRDVQIPQAFADQQVQDSEVLVSGLTAFNLDFNQATTRYTPFVFAFVLGMSFLLLLIAFRSIVIPLKAMIMNMLSVAAAYGLIVLVFQKGVGARLFGFQQIDSIDAWLPLFLFCILFGLSMDYHVFLQSRIRERYDETRDNTHSVAFGIRTTAGLITGAALIMVAVFGGFASGESVVLQEMGFGLAFAVLMDATIVRVVLVPSCMKLLGDANWYFPNWLKWVPDIRVEGVPEPSWAFAIENVETPGPQPAYSSCDALHDKPALIPLPAYVEETLSESAEIADAEIAEVA